ncbi:MAG: hypothetical protein UEY91_03010 [Lachnospiraceae bacterium]|nr:hypothetical protein [Lachnospiraceae bacterium]
MRYPDEGEVVGVEEEKTGVIPRQWRGSGYGRVKSSYDTQTMAR